jgi:hypothetical protein
LRKGDISNELPKRIIVITDVFLQTELIVKKKFKFIPQPKVDRKIDRSILSRLYLFTSNQGVTLEVASFDMSDNDMSLLMEQLDEQGTNPFRYFTSYKSTSQLVNELPYRPEVVGVMDIPSRQLQYGHWGLDRV